MSVVKISGKPTLLREKLLSIPDHISNCHVFPSNTEHLACNHLPLTGDRAKAWLRPDSLVIIKNISHIYFLFEIVLFYQAIQKIRSAILGKDDCRINEVPHMVGFTHTGPVGTFVDVLSYL